MEEVVIYVPRKIENDIQGFEFLIKLYTTLKETRCKRITIDFNKTRWLEANLSAVLGVILEVGVNNNNKITIKRISKSISRILIKNEFFKSLGIEIELKDLYETTIRYAIFKKDDKIEFQEYLKKEFIPKLNLAMSDEFAKELRGNFEEVFQNARIHGQCDNIHVCGQYFYSNERVKFTIVDIGRTIHQNYTKYFGANISDEDAIDWATKDGSSTKDRDETGGIGLFQLREFIKENGGKIQIISSKGYWEETCGEKVLHKYDYSFDGTIVNIEVDVNKKMYLSKREITEVYEEIDNIF